MVFWGLRSLGWKTPPPISWSMCAQVQDDGCLPRALWWVKSPWQGTLPKMHGWTWPNTLSEAPTLRLYCTHKTAFQWMIIDGWTNWWGRGAYTKNRKRMGVNQHPPAHTMSFTWGSCTKEYHPLICCWWVLIHLGPIFGVRSQVRVSKVGRTLHI